MAYTINKESGIPLYQQLKKYLIDYIKKNRSGSLKLPSENELSRKFSISRPTIRLALHDLEKNGLIEKIHGKGTFIKITPEKLNFFNWHSTEEVTAKPLEHVLDGFLRDNPQVTIKNTGCLFKDMLQQQIVLSGSGTAPDIMSMVYFWIPLLANQGSLHPLTSLYTPDYKNKLYPQTVEAVKYQNEYYALNWTNGPTIFYFNRKILQTVTGTANVKIDYYDELPDLFSAIHEKSKGGIVPFCLPLNDDDLFFVYTIYSFLLSFNGGIVDASGEIIFNSEDNIRAFTWLKKFINSGNVKVDCDIVSARREFAHNRVAFFVDGPWFKSIVPSLNPGENFDIGFQTLPKSPLGLSYSALANHVVGVSSQCRNKELAIEFIKYLTLDRAVSEYLYKHSSMFPVSIEEIETNPVYNDPFGQVLKKQMKTACPIPDAHPAFSYSISFFAKACRQILLGDDNIASVLNNTAAIIKGIYQVRL